MRENNRKGKERKRAQIDRATSQTEPQTNARTFNILKDAENRTDLGRPFRKHSKDSPKRQQRGGLIQRDYIRLIAGRLEATRRRLFKNIDKNLIL